jgi:hypothetical protein
MKRRSLLLAGLLAPLVLWAKPGRTLLVGEVKAGEMAWFEESADGERVSGEWDGDWTASTFTGTWFNADESVKLAFELRRVSR